MDENINKNETTEENSGTVNEEVIAQPTAENESAEEKAKTDNEEVIGVPELESVVVTENPIEQNYPVDSEQPRKKKKIVKRWWFWLIIAVVIVVSVIIVASSFSDDDDSYSGGSSYDSYMYVSPYVNMVKNATHSTYGITYGDAFDEFFSNTDWSYFTSTDGLSVVEFEGDFYYDNAPATAKIQFVIDLTANQFTIYHLSINDVAQSKLMMATLVKKVFESYYS